MCRAASRWRVSASAQPYRTRTGARSSRGSRRLRDRGTASAASRSPPAHAERLAALAVRSEEHTSELQSLTNLVCRLLLEKKKKKKTKSTTKKKYKELYDTHRQR